MCNPDVVEGLCDGEVATPGREAARPEEAEAAEVSELIHRAVCVVNAWETQVGEAVDAELLDAECRHVFVLLDTENALVQWTVW